MSRKVTRRSAVLPAPAGWADGAAGVSSGTRPSIDGGVHRIAARTGHAHGETSAERDTAAAHIYADSARSSDRWLGRTAGSPAVRPTPGIDRIGVRPAQLVPPGRMSGSGGGENGGTAARGTDREAAIRSDKPEFSRASVNTLRSSL